MRTQPLEAGWVILLGSSSLQLANTEIGEERLRVVVVKLLGWMKSQHRMGKLRPLVLKSHYHWCQDLTLLMEKHQLFSEILELRQKELVLRSSLSEETQLELCAIVDRNHEPRLIT